MKESQALFYPLVLTISRFHRVFLFDVFLKSRHMWQIKRASFWVLNRNKCPFLTYDIAPENFSSPPPCFWPSYATNSCPVWLMAGHGTTSLASHWLKPGKAKVMTENGLYPAQQQNYRNNFNVFRIVWTKLILYNKIPGATGLRTFTWLIVLSSHSLKL